MNPVIYIAEAGWKAAQPQWQSIDSAPKDGARVLLSDGACVFCGYWDNRYNYWGEIGWVNLEDSKSSWYSSTPNYPTYWMPLPEPPNV